MGGKRSRSLAKLDMLEIHDHALLENNRRSERQLVTAGVEKEHHKAQTMGSTKAFTDVRIELANAKEALHVRKSWASTDRLALHSSIEERDRAQMEVVTMLAELQVAKRALNTTFDPPLNCI